MERQAPRGGLAHVGPELSAIDGERGGGGGCGGGGGGGGSSERADCANVDVDDGVGDGAGDDDPRRFRPSRQRLVRFFFTSSSFSMGQ